MIRRTGDYANSPAELSSATDWPRLAVTNCIDMARLALVGVAARRIVRGRAGDSPRDGRQLAERIAQSGPTFSLESYGGLFKSMYCGPTYMIV